MAALLVALGVMAVMLTMAMPVWQQTAQREKEQELVFRGQQYVRAIGLFEKKYANTPPPTLDVLIQEHFLRKKYKDPITNGDFVPIPAGQTSTAATAPASGTAPAQGAGRPAASGQATAAGSADGTAGRGGIAGVTSASTARSLRIYNGGTHYNQWRFIYAAPAGAPGAGGAGTAAGTPGQRGRGAGPQTPSGPTGGAGRSGTGAPSRGNPGGGGRRVDPEGPRGRGR